MLWQLQVKLLQIRCVSLDGYDRVLPCCFTYFAGLKERNWTQSSFSLLLLFFYQPKGLQFSFLVSILPPVWSVTSKAEQWLTMTEQCPSFGLFANHMILSFLLLNSPVTATFVSTENASGNQEGVQDAICQALFVGMLFALVGAALLLLQPDRVLSSVLKRT
jgi:heme/copper-type cytochrome/quinol oxidase subunit 3